MRLVLEHFENDLSQSLLLILLYFQVRSRFATVTTETPSGGESTLAPMTRAILLLHQLLA